MRPGVPMTMCGRFDSKIACAMASIPFHGGQWIETRRSIDISIDIDI